MVCVVVLVLWKYVLNVVVLVLQEYVVRLVRRRVLVLWEYVLKYVMMGRLASRLVLVLWECTNLLESCTRMVCWGSVLVFGKKSHLKSQRRMNMSPYCFGTAQGRDRKRRACLHHPSQSQPA